VGRDSGTDALLLSLKAVDIKAGDELLRVFIERQIGHDVYYPVPFHLLECYRDMKLKKGDYPVSEKAADSVVSIPVFPQLKEEEQEEVIEIVRSVSA